MKCKNCNGEIEKKAIVCVHCGCKIKKPVYKKWWFWTIVVIFLIIAVSSSGGSETNDTKQSIGQETAITSITYEATDLGEMLEELKLNAMKAESKYQGKSIEFMGKIKSFDSDGEYISVEPVDANEWNFETVMCYIKNDEQKSMLIEKNVGDTLVIRGKVKTIGEIIGYSIDIAEIE